MTEGNIVTFYSYKGGVGRTFALASIGTALAQWGYKVLCIDWDLEAPGLHLYFESLIIEQQHPGLVELIEAYIAGEPCKWQNFITTVHLPDEAETLSFMPAGFLDESYIRRMQSLAWAELYQSHNLGQYLEELRNQWKQEFDFVLIDSRTGITDIGGICTVQLPDFLVLLFTANHQSLDGAYNVINLARRQRNALPFDREKLLVLPVVTRFEGRVEYETAQEWLTVIENKLEPLYSDWKNYNIQPADLLNFTRIPYIPYWSFGERIPVLEEDTKDPESAGYALETLAAMVAQKLADTDTLVSNRDNLVANAKLGPSRKRTSAGEELWQTAQPGVSLFLSYSHKDESLAKELMKHLNVLHRQGVINVFNDRRIVAGTEWAQEISLALENAQVILLLISANFLASDYAFGVETRRALSRHENGEAIVLPVLLRPVDFSDSPLARLQVLPSDGRPVSIWENQDEAWVDVIQGLRKAVSDFSMKQSQILIN